MRRADRWATRNTKPLGAGGPPTAGRQLRRHCGLRSLQRLQLVAAGAKAALLGPHQAGSHCHRGTLRRQRPGGAGSARAGEPVVPSVASLARRRDRQARTAIPHGADPPGL